MLARRSLAAALLCATPLAACRAPNAQEDERAASPLDPAAFDAGADAGADTGPLAQAGAEAGAAAPDLGDPWRMRFVDVQGRGVMIDHLDIRSFAAPLLQAGDIIIGVDDRSVVSSAELDHYLRTLPPGAIVVITLERGDQLQYVMLQVPEAPP